MIGLAVGAGLVALATRQREKLPIFAQGVLGAGISILYLSVYASFNFYSLVPQLAAVVAMSAVTLIAFERGIRFQSLAVGILAWAGGFLTPIVLRGGETAASSPSGLFIYLFLLNVGLLALVMRKREWWVLEPMSLAATYLVYLGHYVDDYSAENAGITLLFLTGIWGLYYATDLMRLFLSVDAVPLQTIAGSANSALYYWAGGVVVYGWNRDALAAFSAGLALAYAIPLLLLRRSVPRYAFKAALLLVIATALQFDGFLRVALLSAEGLGILLSGIFLRIPHLRIYGPGILTYAFLTLINTPGAFIWLPRDEPIPILTGRLGAFLFLAACLAAGGFFYRRLEEESSNVSAGLDELTARPVAEPLLHYAWSFLLTLLIAIETFDRMLREGAGLVPIQRAVLVLAVLWSAYALGLVWSGNGRLPAIVHSGVAVGFLAVIVAIPFAAIYVPVIEFSPVANARALTLMALTGALYLQTRFLDATPDWKRLVRNVYHLSIGLLTFELVTAETRDFFERQIALAGSSFADAERFRNLQQLALSGAWLSYSSVAIAIGIWRRLPIFRITGIVLLGITILKVFLYDLSFLQDLYRIFSFVGLGVILLVASYAYQRFGQVIFGTADTETVSQSG